MGDKHAFPGEHVRTDRTADTDVVVEYYTAQPAPTQWVAVGVIKIRAMPDADCCSSSLLVGTGRSENAARDELLVRLSRAGLLPTVGLLKKRAEIVD